MYKELSEFLLRRNISQVVFEWQEANKLSLVSMCICAELFIHWVGYSVVWFNKNFMGDWVNGKVFGLLWLVAGQLLLVFGWVLLYTYKHSKGQEQSLRWLQYFILYFYLGYMGLIYVVGGISNIFTGVTIVSSTIIAILLMNRRAAWYTFLVHIALICALAVLPLLKIETEKMYGNLDDAGRLFWYFFYLFLSLPKAFLSVGFCIQLVKGIESRLKQAQYHANYDKLTQVTNRRYIMQHMFNVLFLAKSDDQEEFDLERKSQALSVILLDIDFFKSINDTYGHLSGDMVLMQLAKRVSNMMTGCGWEVCRHGGEEFLVVLPQTPHSEAMEFAGKLHGELCTGQYRIVDSMSIEVTSSFGVATFEHEEVVSMRRDYYRQYRNKPIHRIDSEDVDGSTNTVSASREDLMIESLINMADSALYDAKRLGRNRIISANQYVDETSSRSSIEMNVMKTEEILQELPLDFPLS